MCDPLLWNDVPVLVDGELVLAANGADFGLLHFEQGFQHQGDSVAQFNVLGHEFGDCGTVFVAEG